MKDDVPCGWGAVPPDIIWGLVCGVRCGVVVVVRLDVGEVLTDEEVLLLGGGVKLAFDAFGVG